MNSSSLSRSIASTFAAFLAGLTALAALWAGSNTVAAGAITVALAASVASAYFLWRTRRVVAAVIQFCSSISKGDFEARLLHVRESGDLADLQHALNDMTDRCDAFVRESGAAMEAVRQNKYYRRIRPEGLYGALVNGAEIINAAMQAIQQRVSGFGETTSQFDGAIGGIVDTLFAASTKMGGSANVMRQGASAMRERATAVAAASEETSTNMSTVAAAVTELSASATEVAREVERSTQIAHDATAKAEEAQQTIEVLSGAGERIGEVVKLINAIADQTNLLALNATIEAARAGDAGKGFAVVAHEVKALAAQTARATSEISQHIGEVRTASQNVVEVIGQITKIIADLNRFITGVADAISGQSAATGEIARNVEQASAGIHEITSNIHRVSDNAVETEKLAEHTAADSGSLSEQAMRLTDEVKSFLSRAAVQVA
jgi:methyl-accepting chemotaxis protein